MAEEMRQGYCRTCQQYGPVRRKGISHILHLILTLVTFGLWLFAWLALALLNVGGWRCTRCGGNSVDQVGELFSFKGWLLLVVVMIVLTVAYPDGLGALTGFILLLSIPAFIIGAQMQKKRREEGVQRQYAPAAPATPAEHQEEPEPREPYRDRDAMGDRVEYDAARGQFSAGPDGERPVWESREDYLAASAEHQELLATFTPPVTVSFDYEGATNAVPHPREVEVTKLLRCRDRLYLQGWCLDQEDERMFRTDRIQGGAYVKATGEALGLQVLHNPARLQMALMAANVL